MFHILHDKLGIGECESRDIEKQTAHIHLCLMSFILLEAEKQATGKTWYQLRRIYRFQPREADLLSAKLNLVGA